MALEKDNAVRGGKGSPIGIYPKRHGGVYDGGGVLASVVEKKKTRLVAGS